ncbi:MAG: glycosyltransferase family 4 protein [Bacteroidota bacterium]
MRILFLTPYPQGVAPSQRFRFEQYFEALRRDGHVVTVSPFLDLDAWKILYRPGRFFSKISGITRGYFRRFLDMIAVSKHDIVFIHREASPFGPPWMEWFIAKVSRKPLVFDFDDAIWIPNSSENNRHIAKGMRSFSKTGKIIRWSSMVFAGNSYLADYARKLNHSVEVIPTTIDTVGLHNMLADHLNIRPVIGWTGSHSTLPLLESLVPVLKRLRTGFDFELRVICDVPPEFKLDGLVFVPWSKENEISELLKFDIGIMPLPDNEWTRGKCGFKALQYMSLGIPAVVSPVGVNSEIVTNGVNGLHCTSDQEWYDGLAGLLRDKNRILQLSIACRSTVEKGYSVNSQKDRYLSLFNRVAARR